VEGEADEVSSNNMTLFLTLALLLLQSVDPPATRGTLTLEGTVRDSTGAAFPGATVSIKSRKGGLPRATTSNGLGRYSLPKLWDGNYDVVFEAPDFKTESKSVDLPTTSTVDVTMTVRECCRGGVNANSNADVLSEAEVLASARRRIAWQLVSHLWKFEIQIEDLGKPSQLKEDARELVKGFHATGKEAVPLLALGLSDDDAQVRRNVCVVLMDLATDTDIAEAVPTLAMGYRDADPVVRKWTLQVLQKIQAKR
jgi:hypothetical protein